MRVSDCWSCGESGVADDVVDGGLVGGGCAAERGGRAGVGELSESGGQYAVVYAGEEHRGVQASGGDLVAVGGRDALDEVVAAEPAQVVGHLPGADGGHAAQFGGELAQVAVGEATGEQPEDQ